ncbi:MAG TPA: methyltransferase domain-containing protein [Xanthobacteraceae bacterium]|nr:methyltransferase domain-containing protein [Xanthobacteraceae bacterium]
MGKPALSDRLTRSALAAEAWSEVREPLDRQLSPLGLRAIEVLNPLCGDVIVDVGCGTGQTVLQLADKVGPEGRVIGIDIAPLLLDVAQERARGIAQVGFVSGDALLLDLPDLSIDAFFSRFGVMAFPDPVAAFSNFHRMLKPAGRMTFVCWRSLDENELDFFPLRAAGLEHLVDATPFSFADPAHIQDTLERAGFKDISISAHDQAVTSGDLDATIRVLLRVGPLGRIVRENPELRASAEACVRAALVERGNTAAVCLQAATWIVTARA